MIVIAAMVTHFPIVEAMNDRKFPQWDELYVTHPAESMPWFYPGIDPDRAPAIERHAASGRALDLGTGPGTEALVLAERGFDVTRDPACLRPPCAAAGVRPDRQDPSYARFGLPDISRDDEPSAVRAGTRRAARAFWRG
jgi:hypothetical protein